MKLKDVLNDIQIESLFEKNYSELDPKEIYNQTGIIFKITEKEEVQRHIEGILPNVDAMFKDMLLKGDSFNIDVEYYKLIREVFDRYYLNLCSTIRNGLTYAIIIPNCTEAEIKDAKFAEYLETTLNHAFFDKPTIGCVFKTCIVRADKNANSINIRFVHITTPGEDRVYNISYDDLEYPNGNKDGKFSICFRVCLLERDHRDLSQVKFIKNEMLKNKKDYSFPDGINFWNKIFGYDFKYMMEFEHLIGDDHYSGIVLHNVV